MAAIDRCPEAARLHGFLLGLLPHGESAALEEHLPTCPGCLATAEALQAEDALIDTMRGGAGLAAVPLEEAAQGLVDKMTRLLQSGQDLTPAAAGATPPPMVSSADTTTLPSSEGGAAGMEPVCYDFLAPAQGPDELGRLGPYRVLAVLG